MATVHDCSAQGRGLRIGVCVARFNEPVTRKLLEGALDALARCGVSDEDVEVVWVPGAFELPGAAQRLAQSHRLDAAVVLGAVIRGETAHFDHVARAATDGTQRVILDLHLPIGFGVLTVDNGDQAFARAGDGPNNKGFEAAMTAVEMANVYRALGKSGTQER